MRQSKWLFLIAAATLLGGATRAAAQKPDEVWVPTTNGWLKWDDRVCDRTNTREIGIKGAFLCVFSANMAEHRGWVVVVDENGSPVAKEEPVAVGSPATFTVRGETFKVELLEVKKDDLKVSVSRLKKNA